MCCSVYWRLGWALFAGGVGGAAGARGSGARGSGVGGSGWRCLEVMLRMLLRILEAAGWELRLLEVMRFVLLCILEAMFGGGRFVRGR